MQLSFLIVLLLSALMLSACNPKTNNPEKKAPKTNQPDAEKPDQNKPETNNPDTNKQTDLSKLYRYYNFNTGVITASVGSVSDWGTTSIGSLAQDPKNKQGIVVKDDMQQGKNEWQGGGVHNIPRLTKGHEVWFQVKFLMPSGTNYDAQPWLKFIRFHTFKADGSNRGYVDVYLENDGDWRVIYEGEQVWSELTKDQSHKPVFDTWETYEMHVVFDTVSQDNGGKARVDFWKNNRLVGSATDIKTLVENSDYCNAVLLRTYWNSNSGVPRNQTWYWDDTAIAIKNDQRNDSTLLINSSNGIKFIGSNNPNPK